MTSASGPPPNRRLGSPRTLIAVAPAGNGPSGHWPAFRGPLGPGAPGGGGFFAGPGVVHGQLVVPRVATGSTGIRSVKTGNQVAVTATVPGPAASLTRVPDLSLLRGGRFAPGWGRRPATAG